MKRKSEMPDLSLFLLLLKIRNAAAAFIVGCCQICDTMKEIEINILHSKAVKLILKLKLVIRICLNIKFICYIITVTGISGKSPSLNSF